MDLHSLTQLFKKHHVKIAYLIKGDLIYCEDEGFCDEYEKMVMKKASDLEYKK